MDGCVKSRHVVVLAAAQFVAQLRLQTLLHEPGDRLLEQVLDVVLAGRMYNLPCGASILHLAGGSHKIWDGLHRRRLFAPKNVKIRAF